MFDLFCTKGSSEQVTKEYGSHAEWFSTQEQALCFLEKQFLYQIETKERKYTLEQLLTLSFASTSFSKRNWRFQCVLQHNKIKFPWRAQSVSVWCSSSFSHFSVQPNCPSVPSFLCGVHPLRLRKVFQKKVVHCVVCYWSVSDVTSDFRPSLEMCIHRTCQTWLNLPVITKILAAVERLF